MIIHYEGMNERTPINLSYYTHCERHFLYIVIQLPSLLNSARSSN